MAVRGPTSSKSRSPRITSRKSIGRAHDRLLYMLIFRRSCKADHVLADEIGALGVMQNL
jgi:hypothetical protein